MKGCRRITILLYLAKISLIFAFPYLCDLRLSTNGITGSEIYLATLHTLLISMRRSDGVSKVDTGPSAECAVSQILSRPSVRDQELSSFCICRNLR